MKKLILLLLLVMVSSSLYAQPFYRKTKHKPIKRMTRSEVRKAQVGVSLYVRENGKVYRNTGRVWTRVNKPKDNSIKKTKRR